MGEELKKAQERAVHRDALLAEMRAALWQFVEQSFASDVGSYEHGTVYGQLRHEINSLEIEAESSGLAARRRIRRKIGPGKRLRIFKRDSFTCVVCGWRPPNEVEARRRLHKRSGQYLTIGHRIPVVEGGSNDPENLQTECNDCNQGRGKSLPEDG